MRKTNQKGFGIVEVLLLIVLMGLVGGVGYYVYSQSKKNDTESKTQVGVTTEKPATEKAPAVTDETADWLLYESPGKEFSIRLADGWVLERYQKLAPIYAAESSNIVLKNGTKAKIVEVDGGRDFNYVAFGLWYYDAQDLNTVGTMQKTFKTDQGLNVEKYYYKQLTEPDGIGLPKGTEEYNYYIKSGEKYVGINHDVIPGQTEQTVLVEKVIKTLKIN